ncbi:MAG: response regulator transcription factor [Gammaproteobacteria bacterium]|nr:response regulator transcription factor [Gammaproteobacteria bacterium]
MFKVLLVDDQKLIRDGIKSLLSLSDQVEVVGECSDGRFVLNAVRELKPDVILLDMSMPQQDGLTTLKQLHQEAVATPCLVLTTFDDHELILQSISNGAKGFLLKDVSLETLIEAIAQVAKGESFLLPAITDNLLRNSPSGNDNYGATANEALTVREVEILRLVAGGYSNKEIAGALHKSEGTIKNHVSNILSKLGVRDRTRAVLLALERNML